MPLVRIREGATRKGRSYIDPALAFETLIRAQSGSDL
jgi:hypothetical protein